MTIFFYKIRSVKMSAWHAYSTKSLYILAIFLFHLLSTSMLIMSNNVYNVYHMQLIFIKSYIGNLILMLLSPLWLVLHQNICKKVIHLHLTYECTQLSYGIIDIFVIYTLTVLQQKGLYIVLRLLWPSFSDCKL